MGNDSGRMVVLEYSSQQQKFEKVYQSTFGRSGCRRIIPGQYVASDPRGRAVITAAVDRQKLIYTMNRDPTKSKLVVSSPLEAHKPSTILYDVIGVDVGYENPIFACLEVEYGEFDDDILEGKIDSALERTVQKNVSFYELDLGLNNATCKFSEVVPESSNHLIQVPGGTDGPGGVLVCSENQVSWHNHGFEALKIEFPPRAINTDRHTIISCSTFVKAKNGFFFLLQTEEGDLFKLSIDYSTDGVHALRMRYYDTVAVASSLAVLKSGFLLVSAECANHLVYQIQSLGDYEDEPEWRSGEQAEPFLPRPLRNLAAVDQLENISPVTCAQILNLGNEETPQIYCAQGSGNLSSFNVLRYGLGVSEIAQSDLPEEPTGLWVLKNSLKDERDALLILAFSTSTVVLSVGESIEEVSDSGFLNDVKSLGIFQLANDAYVQVHPSGVRQISSTHGYSEWKCPSAAEISHCAYNERQLVVYLNNRSLIYFELDFNGNLSEKKGLNDLPEDICCMYLGPVPHERQRSRFLAIGSTEQVVRIISLDPDDCLEPLSLQALAASPCSIYLVNDSDDHGLQLEAGLDNGVVVTLRVDSLSGSISDARSRFIGQKPIRLAKCHSENGPGLLVLSSRSWLKYEHRGAMHTSPLFYESFSNAASFSSEQTPYGIVGIVGNSLRIVTVENLENLFTRHKVPLCATPKKIAFESSSNIFAFAESCRGGVTPEMFEEMGKQLGRSTEELVDANTTVRSTSDFWASSVEIFDPFKGKISARVQFDHDESIQCLTFLKFFANPNQTMLAVGVSKKFCAAPRSAEESFIYLYSLDSGNTQLVLIHKTPLEQIPSCMVPFAGRLLIGVGNLLRLYDLGQKRLLRKCEIKFPTFLMTLQTQGWRIIVGDAHESILFVQYRHEEGQFMIFADEAQPRPVSTACMLDYDSIAVADRFGTFAVLRLPASVSESVDTDGTALVTKRDLTLGAEHKLEKHVEYYLGDTIVSLQKIAMVYGSREAIQYLTVSGSIGVFVPFSSRNDALLLQNLEMFMRSEAPAVIGGREHIKYRSSYAPVKSVIDGDLCEQFAHLSPDRQQAASQSLEATPEEIIRKLQSIRSNVGF